MRKIWIYIHIPKCGGSTFADILRRNYGPGFMTTNSIINNYQYRQDQVLDILDHYPDCTCLAGHKLSLDLPYTSTRYQLTVSTFVRDPVDRFLSAYFYFRHHSEWGIPEAKALNLDDYIQWALVEGNQPLYINGQTKFLSGQASSDGLEVVRKSVEDGRLLLLPLARFAEVLVVLRRKYPAQFTDTWYKPRNVSNKDQVATLEQRALIGQFCQIDQELCRMAESFFDQLKADCFPVATEFEPALSSLQKQAGFDGLRGRLGRKGASLLRKAADILEGKASSTG